MADGSISRRENIQFEALLDIYSEKLPELEKCIRKSKIHQKDCVMMMTYFTLAVGITGLLALFVPSTISGTTAIVACSILVNLLFIGILKAWGHSVGQFALDLGSLAAIAAARLPNWWANRPKRWANCLKFPEKRSTVAHSNHQKGSIQAVNEKLHANVFLNYQMKES
ncbi:hypothetical protein GCK72_005860 [Caenorhabditis remanei]|uniref:Uncharacterized protein n=1 Tax=Caenorhabditis remanei TaxID=31234 RepID=A0A6A5HGF7_CAERE|nr:hypothetical protein GCK72_005860 [Caenorhabditis remanei]KAF1765907.1 hypothetical protein GCK72_005860 [Caenorhabditis remanei]